MSNILYRVSSVRYVRDKSSSLSLTGVSVVEVRPQVVEQVARAVGEGRVAQAVVLHDGVVVHDGDWGLLGGGGDAAQLVILNAPLGEV